jgi:hypothetical protein
MIFVVQMIIERIFHEENFIDESQTLISCPENSLNTILKVVGSKSHVIILCNKNKVSACLLKHPNMSKLKV